MTSLWQRVITNAELIWEGDGCLYKRTGYNDVGSDVVAVSSHGNAVGFLTLAGQIFQLSGFYIDSSDFSS